MGDDDIEGAYDDDDDAVCDGCVCGDDNDYGSGFSGGNDNDDDYHMIMLDFVVEMIMMILRTMTLFVFL